MTINDNIILDIFRNCFIQEILEFVDDCVMSLDHCELEDIFEATVDYALLNSIDSMEIGDYFVEGEEGQKVLGTYEILVSVDGYERRDEGDIFKESGIMNLGIGFSFHNENNEYSNFEQEYLY